MSDPRVNTGGPGVRPADTTEDPEVRADRLTVRDSFVRSAYTDTLDMKDSGAGAVSTVGPVDMRESGAGLIVADAPVEMKQAGAGVLVANEVRVENGWVGVLASKHTEVTGDARILVGLREAAILGVVAGVVFGLFDALLRATARRG